MNPRDASLVQRLTRAGFRQQLIAFYDEFEQRLPDSVVPDEMRAVISATP